MDRTAAEQNLSLRDPPQAENPAAQDSIFAVMQKRSSAGCALARRRNMSQATALGARMCQGTFFFTVQRFGFML